MRTRSFANVTAADGSYTFPQPIRAKKLVSAMLQGDDAAAWNAGVMLYAPVPTSFLLMQPEEWVCIGKDIETSLDGKDHLIYAIAINKGVADSFMLTIREEV